MNDTLHLARIALLSRRLRWVVWFVLGSIAIVTAAILLLPSSGGAMSIGLGDDEAPLAATSFGTRVAVLLAMTPALLIWVGLLWRCDRLLRLYERGVVLARDNAIIIRELGQLIMALSVVRALQPFLTSLFTGFDNLEVGVAPFGLFAIGVGVVVIGHVMSLGAEMAAESELTI